MRNGREQDDDENVEVEPFSMDIRVFLAVITITMITSFGLGVYLGPTNALNASHRTFSENLGLQKSPLNTDFVENPKEPAGQHLLVDIKGIEADFLDSEERLARAMVDTVAAAGLSMLSYHCHALIPKGVSCVGVLTQSHISFHTWPDEGVITLDLFTCGNRPLIPVVNTIKELFGIGENIQAQWSHELRGFRVGAGKGDRESYALLDHNSDLSQMVWSPFDCAVKEQVASTLTKYQRVDIWDVVGLEAAQNSAASGLMLAPGESPLTSSLGHANVERMLFLDGNLQSSSASFREYHEAMVQPAMFAHPNPRHVAIIGGGDGASLREVLKHKTLASVTHIEIDRELIDISKELLPEMSDCSDFASRSNNCFDDSLTELVCDDAKLWFVDRFGTKPTKQPPGYKFDVVIMDAIEPEAAFAFSKNLYDDSSVLSAIMNSLSDDGILAIQVGHAPAINDPRPDIGPRAHREVLFRTLESIPSVQAMLVYEDARSGFAEPRAFLIVCKNESCRRRWYAPQESVDYEIHERIVASKSGVPVMSYFDGRTQFGYQVAPKAWEALYCRRQPTPFECAYRYLPPTAQMYEFQADAGDASAFRVLGKWSEDGKKLLETFVYANVDIPKGSFIMPEHMASSLVLPEEAIDALLDEEDSASFAMQHHMSTLAGAGHKILETGIASSIRKVHDLEKSNIGRWVPPHPDGKRPVYSPVYERHRMSFDVYVVATRDISKGEELLKHDRMWESF